MYESLHVAVKKYINRIIIINYSFLLHLSLLAFGYRFNSLEWVPVSSLSPSASPQYHRNLNNGESTMLSIEWVSDAAVAAAGGRQETWLTDGWMALVVTASVACSCCIRTNCIVTKVTMAWRRDPAARHPCMSNLRWFLQQSFLANAYCDRTRRCPRCYDILQSGTDIRQSLTVDLGYILCKSN